MGMKPKSKQREVRIEYMRLDEIQRDEGNPKSHDLSALAESLERFGFVSPMGINEKTGKLLWGHGRLDDLVAFMEQGRPILEGLQVDDDGMWKAPVVRGVHLNPKDGTAYLISDNAQVLLGGWNEPKLVETLIRIAGGDGRGLRGTGYDGDDVDTLIRLYRPDLIDMPEDPGPQIDRAAELQEKWGTALGQIWEMGDHRLAVGDCTDKAVVDAVMGGEKYNLLVTDPPYGVSYADKNKFLNAIAPSNRIQIPIEGDHFSPDEMSDFWEKAFSTIREYAKPGSCYYVTGPQGGDLLLLLLALRDSGFPLRHMLIWAKNNHVLGRSDYNYKHEPIIYGWVDGAGHKFYGIAGETSLWEIPKPQKSDLHPTMKPIELFERAIQNSTLRDEIVCDPFVGSGTTITACERTNRKARAIDIAPSYCAVAIQRWVDMTGLEPHLMTS